MMLGLLPAIRGGLSELRASGQHVRLIDGYLRPYARAFDGVSYFSYHREALAEFTGDATLQATVRVLPGRWHPWLWTLAMPFAHRATMRRCAVLRVFQTTGALPALVARRLYGVPFVTTYGFWYEALARTPGRRVLQRMVASAGLAAADAVIATTRELADHVSRRVDARKVHLIPNGVDTTRFAPGDGPAGPATTVLYAGRLSAEKNLGLVLGAVAKLAGRVDLRVVFIGDGPAREPLEVEARRQRVQLEIRPFVPHDRLPAALNAADVFVLPSLTEGHPKILLEAMSCGRPCVASDVPGNRAIVQDGETGLLVDPRDPAALAGALERVVHDHGLAGALGRAARAEIVARYDLGPLVAREIELLKTVARRR
jgi:glycosyltransferase involved in cell wall biosynthesis